MGKTQNLGIVSPVPMGDWIAQDGGNNYVTYQKLNVVRHNGAAYMAIQANSNIEPGVANNWQSYWMLLNSDGEQGPQGPVGPQGPTVDVLQETGDSETATMSQKAVTTELNNLETEINTNASDIEASNKQITINTNNIKALFNLQLEKNVLAYDNAELTEEVQQTGGSDLSGLTILDGSYATVNKISGNTVASKNLIVYPYVSQNTMESKQSLTLKSDGTIVANGNNIGWCELANNTTIKLVGGKTYTLGGIPAGVSNASTIKLQIEFFDSENNHIVYIYTQNGEPSVTFTVPETFASFDIFFYVENSTTVTNLVVKPMLNEGAEELPFVPFFEGLKNAQLSGIKSIGKNLYNNYGVSALEGGLALSNSYGTTISTNNANDEVVVTQVPNSSYGEGAYQNGFLFWYYTTPIQEIYNTVTVSFDLEITANPLEVNTMLVLSTYYANANNVSVDGTLLNKKQRVSYTTTKRSLPNAVRFAPYFEIRCCGMSFKISNFQVCASTASNPTVFTPYTESIMQLPHTVELGKWDYIENGKIIRRTSIEAFNAQDYNEAQNTYQGSTDFVLSVDKTLVAVIDEDLPDETFVFDSNKYLVWNGGIEEILTPTDTDGYTCFDYGANTTEENSYYVIVGDNV